MSFELPEIGSTGWLVLGALAILLVGWGIASRAAHRRRVERSAADVPGKPPAAVEAPHEPEHDPEDGPADEPSRPA